MNKKLLSPTTRTISHFDHHERKIFTSKKKKDDGTQNQLSQS